MQNEGEVGCMSVWGGRCDGVGASGGDGGEIEGGGGGGGDVWDRFDLIKLGFI